MTHHYITDRLAQSISPVKHTASLQNALKMMFQTHTDSLPVVDAGNILLGVVRFLPLYRVVNMNTPSSMIHLTAIEPADLTDFIEAMEEVYTEQLDPVTIFERCRHHDQILLPLVDDEGRYTGKCIAKSKLVQYMFGESKPKLLGGLATPLGVYLTDGYHTAGAGYLGLVLTGVYMGILFYFMDIFFYYLALWLNLSIDAVSLMQLLFFLIVLRISPLAKYHAAEHKTIHTLENYKTLTVANVMQEPKEHRRCGTNFFTLFIGINFCFFLYIYLNQFVSVPYITVISGFISLVALGATIFWWRHLGRWVQKYFTTAEPDLIHLQSGIKAGIELLDKAKFFPAPDPLPVLIRLWNTGVVQLITGFLITVYCVDGVVSRWILLY